MNSDKDRDRHIQTDRQTYPGTDRHTQAQTDIHRHSQTYTGADRHTQTQTQAKTDIEPIRRIPFHLRKTFNSTVDQMIEGVFEEYNGPNEWISYPVIVPKDDKSICILAVSKKVVPTP